MNRTLKKALIAGSALLPLAIAGSAYASDILIAPNTDSEFTSLSGITLPNMIQALITLAFVLAAVVAFAFLVFGGITWITSGGDKAKTESARNTITAALVGLLIVFAAWAILSLIQIFFGISIFSLTLPSAVGDPTTTGTAPSP